MLPTTAIYPLQILAVLARYYSYWELYYPHYSTQTQAALCTPIRIRHAEFRPETRRNGAQNRPTTAAPRLVSSTPAPAPYSPY